MLDTLDKIKKEIEVWSVDDPRLPKNEYIIREPPKPDFIESVAKVQLQPIGIAHKDDDWSLAFGRKRLLALRKAKEDGLSDGFVDVVIFHGLGPYDSDVFALWENNQRTSNEVSDYVAIKNLLLSGLNYKEIAKDLGLPVNSIKALDKNWARVPRWAVDACLAGKINTNTAKEVGKVKGKERQNLLQKVLKEEGKLSTNRVRETKRAIQQEIVAKLTPSMGFDVQERDMFTRIELKTILELVKNKTKKEAIAYIEELLAS